MVSSNLGPANILFINIYLPSLCRHRHLWDLLDNYITNALYLDTDAAIVIASVGGNDTILRAHFNWSLPPLPKERTYYSHVKKTKM